MSEMNREVWIGIADLQPKLGNSIFNGAPGAFSNALCLTGNEAEYRRRVARMFGEPGFEVQDLTDIEPLQKRLAAWEVDEEILELDSQLSVSSPVLYDAFYLYESKGDEEWHL